VVGVYTPAVVLMSYSGACLVTWTRP
jgi:hypothetical protein